MYLMCDRCFQEKKPQQQQQRSDFEEIETYEKKNISTFPSSFVVLNSSLVSIFKNIGQND